MKRILVIDDEEWLREMVHMALSQKGFEVLEAENGAAGIEIAQRTLPDLVLCDVNMPNLTGVQLLDIMHKHAIETPVLFVTGYSPDEVESQGLALGQDDYIQKPFRQAALIELVRKAIERGAPR